MNERQTFEEWYKNNGDKISDMSRQNAARAAWMAGYRQRDSDHRRALEIIEGWRDE